MRNNNKKPKELAFIKTIIKILSMKAKIEFIQLVFNKLINVR